MTEIGENIKTYRKKMGVSQKELGELIGVGQTTIANYERGRRIPTIFVLKQMSKHFNTSIDSLVGNKFQDGKIDFQNKDQNKYISELFDFFLHGEEEKAVELVENLNPNPENILFIYEEIFTKVMIQVGEYWQDGRVGVAFEHYASHIMNKLMSMLSVITLKTPKNGKKAVCLAAPREAHILGIKMISSYLELMGFAVHFIGDGVPTTSLLNLLSKEMPDLILITVTMDDNIDSLKNLIYIIRQNKKFRKIKIVVGGQGIKKNSAGIELIGAEGYCNHFEDLQGWLEKEGYID